MRFMKRRFSRRLMKDRMLRGRRALLEGRRALLERRRGVPVKMLIPNMVTLLGLCAGLTGIRFAIEGRFEFALIAIAVAAVLDGIDGRMARLLKASSRFGAELDSLADFVSFGVAPAIVLYLWGFSTLHSLGWIVVLVFSVASALRLARFNVALDDEAKPAWQGAFFVGMPVPAGAIGLMLPLYLEGLGIPKSYIAIQPLLAVFAFFLAYLEVSRIPTFSGKLIGRRVAREHIAPVVALTALAAVILVTYPYLSLTLTCLAYLALLPISIRRYRALAAANAVVTAPALPSATPISSDTDPT